MVVQRGCHMPYNYMLGKLNDKLFGVIHKITHDIVIDCPIKYTLTFKAAVSTVSKVFGSCVNNTNNLFYGRLQCLVLRYPKIIYCLNGRNHKVKLQLTIVKSFVTTKYF